MCYDIRALRAWLIIGLLAVGLNQSVPKQADKPQTNQDSAKRTPSQPAKSAVKSRFPLAGPSPQKEEHGSDSETKQATWREKLLPPLVSNWPLLLVAIWGILVARRTLKAIARQADSMERQTKATEIAANAASNSTRLVEESTRGRMVMVSQELQIPTDGPIRLNVIFKNIGHSVAYVRSGAGSKRWASMPEGPMPIALEPVAKPVDPEGRIGILATDEVVPTKDFLEGLPELKDTVSNFTTKLTVYFFWRLEYETMGKTYSFSDCAYLVKGDAQALITPTAPKTNYLLRSCGKWRSSE